MTKIAFLDLRISCFIVRIVLYDECFTLRKLVQKMSV